AWGETWMGAESKSLGRCLSRTRSRLNFSATVLISFIRAFSTDRSQLSNDDHTVLECYLPELRCEQAAAERIPGGQDAATSACDGCGDVGRWSWSGAGRTAGLSGCGGEDCGEWWEDHRERTVGGGGGGHRGCSGGVSVRAGGCGG